MVTEVTQPKRENELCLHFSSKNPASSFFFLAQEPIAEVSYTPCGPVNCESSDDLGQSWMQL